ncbi:MAG: TonB-dependent receptor, partial [Bacteroidota bacterium]
MLFYKNHIALFLCLFWITPVLGQQNILNRRVTIRFEDHSVEDALEKLMKETKCTINYRPSELPANFRITKFFKQASIRTIIREVWNSNRLIFQVEGNDITVQVTPKDVKNQKGHLKGRLTDIKGNSIPGATIRIKGTTIGNITDLDGWYTLPDLKAGSYTLFISSLGFQRTEQSIEIIGGSTVDLQTTLKDEVGKLDEVVVLGKSQEQLKMEEPIKVEVINTQKLQTKSISLPQIINQTTGIKVRQTGGIGSPTLVNINGLQGNAIRYFKDEIPMDYLGRAFDLTLLPVDQIDNVEIYKGVLPAELGADALGGALNFSSRKNFNNNLDLAYTIGSFNTHQVNLNGYYQIPNTKLFTSLASYYVYSDNNYKVSVPLPDPVTANLVDTEVERFHDAVESYFIDGKVGIKDFKFGDLLVFGYARFDYEKERQNGVGLDPNSALGEVMDLESSDIFSTQYKLTKGKLSVNVFGSYSDRNTLFIDNPEFRYNWLGEQLPLINQGGETNFSSRYYRQLNFKTWTGRVNAKYKLTDKHELTFNHNIISENR